MWSAMAMQDIKMRYRGSLLGPFWLTISMVIMIAAMGLIYARMFNTEITIRKAIAVPLEYREACADLIRRTTGIARKPINGS